MLQFITHKTGGYDELSGAEAVLRGGCRWVQLRMKDASDEEFLSAGRKLAELCRSFGARLILDDRVRLVEELGADGVHVGKNDMPVDEVRRLLGPGRIVGATANSFADIEAAAARGADYIGLGPFRFTSTKQKLSPRHVCLPGRRHRAARGRDRRNHGGGHTRTHGGGSARDCGFRRSAEGGGHFRRDVPDAGPAAGIR